MRILILGGSGLLGSTLVRFLLKYNKIEIHATYRAPFQAETVDKGAIRHFADASDIQGFEKLIKKIKPDVIVNCIGHVKQRIGADKVVEVTHINSIFPHILSEICAGQSARLIHFSTDCVFSGNDGSYTEQSPYDAQDVYGLSKALGEVKDQPHVLTLRTSIIGHAPTGTSSLMDWFLSSEGAIRGYQRMIFSGLPANEIARVILLHILPDNSIHGLYNLAASPISKFDLLVLAADIYEKSIEISPDTDVQIDRSLIGTKFSEKTKYTADSWPNLIRSMRDFYRSTI